MVETRPDDAPRQDQACGNHPHRRSSIKEIADTVHANGGKVISNVNFKLAWMLGNVEPYSDALLAGFETFGGRHAGCDRRQVPPLRRAALTLPKDDSAPLKWMPMASASPNDVPGYAKDEYMPDSMKDENGKAYAYRDAAGNYYESEFGSGATDPQPEQTKTHILPADPVRVAVDGADAPHRPWVRARASRPLISCITSVSWV